MILNLVQLVAVVTGIYLGYKAVYRWGLGFACGFFSPYLIFHGAAYSLAIMNSEMDRARKEYGLPYLFGTFTAILLTAVLVLATVIGAGYLFLVSIHKVFWGL